MTSWLAAARANSASAAIRSQRGIAVEGSQLRSVPTGVRDFRPVSFLRPSPPPFDLEEWKQEPHLARLKPLVQDWGVNGFGTPTLRLPALRRQAGRLLRRRRCW